MHDFKDVIVLEVAGLVPDVRYRYAAYGLNILGQYFRDKCTYWVGEEDLRPGYRRVFYLN